mgnify:CR=1 FL=1
MKKNEIVALIPVREGSQRIKNKNFIPFADGKSILEIKIEHLKKSNCFNHIYISSDSDKAKEIALSNGVEFLPRAPEMCRSDVPWAYVVEHIMNTIPGAPVVTWALATSPLFNDFSRPVDKFFENQPNYDSLVAVLPKKSFFLNKYGRGINYNLGYWHPYSQELETYYEVTGACYIGLKTDMLKWKYWFGARPYLYKVSISESVDVDTPEDFEFAQRIYKI